MSTLENAFLAAVMALAFIAALTAIGGGMSSVASSSAARLCDNYVFVCKDGSVRPCAQPDPRTCYPVGDARRGGI